MKELEEYVRNMPDFPEPEIIFRDVTSILRDTNRLHMAMDSLIDVAKDLDYDLVIDPESGGFILGVPMAYVQHKGFVPVHKKGKLPCEAIAMGCDLEYGQATVKMHKDTIHPGQKVIIVDGLIAAGDTTEATVKLIEQLGGQVVKICFVMKLAGLNGREHPKGYDMGSAIIYEGK